MQVSKLLILALCIILTSVPVAYSYGTIFADTVLPVNADSVHFPDTTSDSITATTVNVGSLTLSDPGGFNVNIPELVEISSEDSINLIGELGFSLGGPDTESVSFSVDTDFQIHSQEFFALFSDITFNIPAEVEEYDTFLRFDSGRYASIFAGVSIELEGDDLVNVLSIHGNTDAVAPNIIGSGNQFIVSAESSIGFKSRTGFIDFTAEESILVHADIIDLVSEQNTEMVADIDFYLIAEDMAEFTSGSHIVSALGDLTFFSERNVDFTSSSGFFVDAGAIDFTAGDAFYLKSSEESISQVTAIAGHLVGVTATETGLLASNDIVFEIFQSQSVISNTMHLSSIGSTIIGNEETNSVDFNAVSNSLSFFLDNEIDGGDAFVMNSSSFDFTVTDSLEFNADNFIGAAGASNIIVDDDTSFSSSSGDISFISTAELGSLFVGSATGQFYTATNLISIGAHSTTFESENSIFASADIIDLKYDSSVSIIAPDFSAIAGENLSLVGGYISLNADDIDISSAPNFVGNPDINIFSGGDMEYLIDRSFIVNSAQDATFAGAIGDLHMSLNGEISMIGTNSVDFLIDDDGYFVIHEDLIIFSDDITIENIGNGDDDDFLSFTFGNEILFNAPVLGYTFEVDDDALFEAGMDVTLTQSGDSSITPTDFILRTLSPRDNSGIFLSADNSIVTNSGDTTSFDGFYISFFAEEYSFTTPLITMDASEELLFSSEFGDMEFDISSSLILNASGHVIFDGETVLISAIAGPLEFFAADSFNVTSINDSTISASVDYLATSSWYKTHSNELEMIVGGNFDVHADSESGMIRFFSLDDMTFVHDDSVTVTAPIFYIKSSGDQLYYSDVGSLSITSSKIDFTGHTLDTTLNQDFSIVSDSVSFFTDEFAAFFDVTSQDASSYRAFESIYFTSDGSITFDHIGGPYSATAEDIFVNGSDSVYIESSNNRIDVRGTDDYTFTSGGATTFSAMIGDATFDSADTIDVTAGRIIMDSWSTSPNVNGGVFLAEAGKIKMDSDWGSINIDSANGVLLQATNTAATASTFLTSTSGVDMTSVEGGMLFNSEGFLPGGNNLSFEFKSTGTFGDIVFDSLLGGIQIHTLNDISYFAGNNLELDAAYGAEYVPEVYMSFDAPSGLFDVNAQRGITINAGKGLDPADILFTQESGSFLMNAANQISLHSTGSVPAESILVDGQSDIRFHTANTGDIRFFANSLLSFDATSTFDANSVNNMFVESTAGSMSFTSVTNADFWTTGGPVHFSTFSSGPGGEITLTANGGNIDVYSGNSTFLTASQFGSFNANKGVFITSFDGSLDVLAASAGSFINLISQGGFQVTSSGNNIDPDDSIWMDASNNIEYGTVNTNTIALNAIDHVTTGTYSRPIITFNAGGDATVFGMKITSDGGIETHTDSAFASSIVGSLLISTNNFIVSESTGTASISTIGTDGISLSADNGLLRIHGSEANSIHSNTKIVGSSGGSLQFIGTGPNVGDSVKFTAPDVNVLSGSHSWSVKTLDADLTNSFTLTTSGDGIFDGTLDEGSSITFDATDSFSAISGDVLSITTDEGRGQIIFGAAKSTSDITIQTQPGSSIDITGGGEYGIFANEFYLTASEITFTADHSDPNENRSEGDIQIGSENTITGSNFETLLISGEESLTIETTGTEGDVGAVLTLEADEEISVTSSRTQIIRNVPEEGGSLFFNALSDVIITNVDTSDSFITFEADNELHETSVRDNTIISSDYFVTVGESMTVTTSGKDSNDDFGVHIQTLTDDISLEALFGSVRFNSESSSLDWNSVDVTLVTDRNGLFEGFSVEITTTAGSFTAESEESSVEMYGRDGVSFTGPTTGSGEINFEAEGLDDNSNFGIRIEADSTGPFEINSPGQFSTTTEGTNMYAKTIEMNSSNSIFFQSNDSDFVIDVDESITVFSQDIVIDSEHSTNIQAAVIDIDAQATITFDASSDITIQTLGSDSDIETFSSGATIFRNGDNFSARSTRSPNSDISFLSFLGRMEFDAGNVANRDGFGLDFVADYGDLSILCLSDDSDIYTDSAEVTFDSGNSVSFLSLLAPGVDNGIILDIGNIDIVAQTSFDVTANTFEIDSANAILLLADDTEGPYSSTGEGGDAIITATGDISFSSNGGITISSPQEGGRVTISSEDDIILDAPEVNIDGEAVMKIPRNLNDFDGRPSRNSPCLTGSFFWYDQLMTYGVQYDNTIGYLCICQSGNLFCHPFFEPSY